MADRINQENYIQMIEALHTCATRVYSISSNLQSVANTACSAIGEEDISVSGIYNGIRASTLKCANLVADVRALAASMSQELEAAVIETEIWADDNEE